MTNPSDYMKIHETSHWRWWTTQDFWNQHRNDISTFFDYPESYVSKLREDFGYDLPTILDLVLDPDSHGGVAGTSFGPYGVTIAADSVYNEDWGVKGFWFYILSLHETVNVWTGHLTHGWPWANGSEIWHGGSQFPNMTDIVVTRELGLNDVSQIQAQRMLSDASVKMLYDLQQRFGWRIYQGLFSLIRQYHVNLATYREPMKTAIIVLFLSSSAGTLLLSLFRQAGVGASDNALRAVQGLFPAIKI
jgi:hypothetical protein